MGKATLAEAWALVHQEALAGDGFVTFSNISHKAEPLGIGKGHLKKLCELDFLEVENTSRKGHRVMYRLPAVLPPAERLAELDRLTR